MSINTSTSSLLDVKDLTVKFSGIVALNKVSFTMGENQICGLIGPNGSGKTTLINCISRLNIQEKGDIFYKGQSLSKYRPHQIISLGISRTFQNHAPFSTMSVLDNILVGGHQVMSGGFVTCALGTRRVRKEEKQLRDLAHELLHHFHVEDLAQTPIKDLPFTIVKRIELARALMSQPKLLIMDEPAGGLNHSDISTFKEFILDIHKKYQISILLIEHNMSLLMAVADYVVCLDSGQKLAEGTVEEIKQHPDVIRVYLGGGG